MRWRTSPTSPALTPLQKFSLVTLISVVAVTVVACGLGGWLLVRHLVAHDAALAGDLARLLLTRSLPASLFFPTAAADPSLYARTMNDIAAADDVVRVVLYDAQARVLWSDDTALIGRRFAHDNELRRHSSQSSIGHSRPSGCWVVVAVSSSMRRSSRWRASASWRLGQGWAS
ncbi:MAG: hypothetical protein DMD89_39230 [Candidatus Rokuibacteriota bacterium]|nr:MAG: hypothetical protein DMD89_39230 [Candidatus Rokubacteria bacterium]